MGFEIPYTDREINEASKKIITVQNVENGYVRPVAWRGSEMMAISAQQTKIHVAIGGPDLNHVMFIASFISGANSHH